MQIVHWPRARSYARSLCKGLDADCFVEAVSGIGLICRCVSLVVWRSISYPLRVSHACVLIWYPLSSYDGLADNFACPVETMPQRYGDKLGGARGRFPWDFRRFRPDAVVSD